MGISGKSYCFLPVLVAVLGVGVSAQAVTNVAWIAGDGAWETTANWAADDGIPPTNRLPVAGERANIYNGGTARMTATTGSVPASGDLSMIRCYGSNSKVFQNGGAVRSAMAWIGASGGGTYQLDDGAFTLTGQLDISGINAGSQVGYFIQNGGMATVNSIRMCYKGSAPKAYYELTDGALIVNGNAVMGYAAGEDTAWFTQSGGTATIGGKVDLGSLNPVSGAGWVIMNLDGGELTIKHVTTPLAFVGGTTNYVDFDGGALNLKGTWDYTALTSIANSDFRFHGETATPDSLTFELITIDAPSDYTRISATLPPAGTVICIR